MLFSAVLIKMHFENFGHAIIPCVPFKSQSSILPLEVIACVPRGSLSGIANESTTIGVRITLFFPAKNGSNY